MASKLTKCAAPLVSTMLLLMSCRSGQLAVRAPVSTIQIKTGIVEGAGTDAHVFIRLFGDGWSTACFELDNDDQNFENGDTDEFEYGGMPFERVTSIRIWHDNTEGRAGWFLDEVVLNLNDACGHVREQKFPVNRWLARDEDDHAICIVVDADGSKRACSD